jgi:hypothetical protein
LLSESHPPTGLKETENADARGRIAALEEKAKQHDSAIAVLQNKFTQFSTDLGCFAGKSQHYRLLQRGCRYSSVRFLL